MYKTSFRVSLFVIILMLPFTTVYAAGLGKLMLNSSLGQPLNAEIDIVTTHNDDILSLKASIATREAFAQAGIHYEPSFSSFKISIESRTNGNPYIKLSSPQAVNDPFLNILMELNWASGRLLREYTVLLDPAEVNTQDLTVPNVRPAPIMVATRENLERASDAQKDNQVRNSSQAINRSSNRSKETYGPVNRGDTLSSIARRILPAGVDLNQMLVALYRANQEAFISSNMNLLKVGAVLKIPEKSEIAAIDASTAKAEIRMQVGDWHNYQGKIASISSKSAIHSGISQSDQGQITTSIDKKTVSAHESPKEILRLSSGSQLIDKEGQISESTLVDRLRMMEEDAIARNLALQEANQRVAMLEKSIENLKQLLELKDSVLAQAQVKAESVSKAGIKPEIQSLEVIDSLTEEGAGLDINSLQMQETSIPQATNGSSIKEAEIKLPPPETDDQSLTDQIFDNIEYLGAALISILLVILLILRKRRNQSKEEEIDETGFSSALRSRMAPAVAAQATPVTETEHVVEETGEEDLTYENINAYSEAEEQDEDFDKDPDYYEEHTDHTEESDTKDNSDSELNNQTIDLNFEKDSEDPDEQSINSITDNDSSDFADKIEFDLSDEADEFKQNLTLEQTLTADNVTEGHMELPDNTAEIQEAANTADYELEINFENSEQPVDSSNTEDRVTEKNEDNSDGIEFEFTDSAIDLAEEEPLNKIEIPEINDPSLELDRPQEAMPDTAKSEFVSKNVPELELADIDLNIEDSTSIDENKEQPGATDKSEHWQEIETKLDLAKAYQEMDDKEGAKEMLEEVIRDGDAKQKKAAKKLLKSL
ncbi:MAG: FimV/HubP family polar landmark protein [Pseudomonadota bacterium]